MAVLEFKYSTNVQRFKCYHRDFKWIVLFRNNYLFIKVNKNTIKFKQSVIQHK